MSSSYFLEGPIPAGDPVILTYQTGTTLYVLNTYVDANGVTQMFFDSSVVTTVQSGQALTTVPVFSVIGQGASGSSPTAVIMAAQNLDLSGINYFSYSDQTYVPGFALSGRTIIFDQQAYNPWGPPALFLTGVVYTVKAEADGTPLNFNVGTMGTSGPTITGKTSNALVVPVVWYYGCNGNVVNTSSTIECTVNSNFCNMFPTSSECVNGNSSNQSQCSGISFIGWSTQQDCINGNRFSYCGPSTFCSSCQGPCANVDDICSYSPSISGYKCVFDPNKLFQGEFWKQPWFIITVSVIFGLGLILAIVVYLAYLKRK